MNEFMAKVLDNMKQDQKQDEASLARAENQVKDLEGKLRDRSYCIAVLEKAVGR